MHRLKETWIDSPSSIAIITRDLFLNFSTKLIFEFKGILSVRKFVYTNVLVVFIILIFRFFN